jgi:hypothetical protein
VQKGCGEVRYKYLYPVSQEVLQICKDGYSPVRLFRGRILEAAYSRSLILSYLGSGVS